jgi:MtN3 and saliva related transmembrane protein
MKFEILDDKVSLTTNIFLIVANIINLTYNIPQVWKTFKTKSTGDFSETFLVMRILGNTIWIGYAIEINSMLMLINNMVVIFSTIFLGYYKVLEIIKKQKTKTKTKRELTFDNSQTNHEPENDNNDINDNINNNNNINNLKGLSEKDKLLTEFTVSF